MAMGIQHIQELEPHDRMLFSVIARKSIFMSFTSFQERERERERKF